MQDINEIMSLDIDNLKEKQREALKIHVLARLKLISNYIENNRFKEARSFTFASPAGDGRGLDSVCIDFNYGNYREAEPLDIGEVLEKLESLL